MKKTGFQENWIFTQEGRAGERVTLPHDAMIHGVRAAGNPGGSAQAYFPGGQYVYEKTFARPEAEHVIFQFEGVYKNAKVSINGKAAGGAAYGYLPFFVEADEYLVDGENTIRVECGNADQPDSRWYSGAGIYRPVFMWTGPKGGIAPEAVKIDTVSIDPAKIRVRTACQGEPEIEILDGETVIAAGRGQDAELAIPDAVLWSEDSPKLYTCRVKLGGDEAETTFGVRMLTWNDTGFYVNGKNTLLRGGCIHHDNGIVGAAAYDEAEWRRVRIMKDAGFNAIRSAHNPASRALLEACDFYGMYVMDESWDMWYKHKSKYDYASYWKENYLGDLQAIVDRDYNHPSVVMYSIGNEVSEPAKEEGIAKTKEMAAFLRAADPSRPVTAGMNLMILTNASKGKEMYKEDGGLNAGNSEKKSMNSTMFNMITNMVGTGMNKAANGKAADKATSPCLDALDIAGYNYASGRYPLEGAAHPQRIVCGSETFPQDIAKNWAMVKQYPYLIGDFMWVAWDYIGEAGLGAWAYTKDGGGFNKPYPWLLADSGALDITGTPNGEMFLAQAVWGLLDKPVIGVQPVNHPGVNPAKMAWRGTNAIASWAWNGCEGNKAVVEVYFDAATAELVINGKSLGKKKMKGCRAVFKTKYASGKIEAIAYDAAGKEIARSELVSAAGKMRICAEPETQSARPGDVVYVNMAIVGENGVVESNADCELTVSVEGGELLGFGSANPRTEERFDQGRYKTYYGTALAAVRVKGNTTVTVTGGGMSAQASIEMEEKA